MLVEHNSFSRPQTSSTHPIPGLLPRSPSYPPLLLPAPHCNCAMARLKLSKHARLYRMGKSLSAYPQLLPVADPKPQPSLSLALFADGRIPTYDEVWEAYEVILAMPGCAGYTRRTHSNWSTNRWRRRRSSPRPRGTCLIPLERRHAIHARRGRPQPLSRRSCRRTLAPTSWKSPAGPWRPT